MTYKSHLSHILDDDFHIMAICLCKVYPVNPYNILATAWQNQHTTKTCPYNIDPLKPHFYIVKLGFTGAYIIFPISAQNINCGTH